VNGARGGRDVVACDLWVFAECKLGMSGVRERLWGLDLRVFLARRPVHRTICLKVKCSWGSWVDSRLDERKSGVS